MTEFLSRLRQATRILLNKPPFPLKIVDEFGTPITILGLRGTNGDLVITVETETT